VKDAFQAQLRRWPLARLGQAIERLVEAEIAAKRTAAPAESLTARALIQLAQAARAR
jgi:DNA polymerase III subunit delta